MSVTYDGTLKNTRMSDVITATGTAGVLKLYTASYAAELVSVTLPLPTLDGTNHKIVFTPDLTYPMSATIATNGRPQVAKIFAAGDLVNPVVTGLTVDSSGADIIITTPIVDGHPYLYAGFPLVITSCQIAHG